MLILSCRGFNNKSYALTKRPWEEEYLESIDLNDSLCVPLRIYSNKIKISRILPDFNTELNLSWISEKTRFFSDSLSVQQLDCPTMKILSNLNHLIDFNEFYFYEDFYNIDFNLDLDDLKEKTPEYNLIIISWKSLTYIVLNKLKNYSNVLCSYYVGNFLDLETILFIKESALYYSSNSIKNLSEYNNLNPQNVFNADFDSNYIFKNDNFNRYQNIFLIHMNLRTENAILNAKLRQKFLWDSQVNIFIVGSKGYFTYKYIHLGLSTKTLLSMLEGRHYLLSSLRKPLAKNLLLYNSNLNDCYKATFHKLFFNYLKIYKFHISYLVKSASSFGSIDLSLDRYISKKTKLNFFRKRGVNMRLYIQCNKIQRANTLFLKNLAHDICVYQNSHGDNFFAFMDFFLPSTSYSEKGTAWYTNCFGILRLKRQFFYLEMILHRIMLIF